ncbi:MAG: aspartate carbamoyltransferase catalytic subunit [Planctomycetota bacterium]|jgi:aspartate carbamoyltransferase catalytic subunit
MEWKHRHLLGLEYLSAGEITHILDTAESLREVSTRSIKKIPTLRGRVVVNLFFEPSTRTALSFKLAATRMSADVLDFTKDMSSAKKGETLVDTAKNIEAMGIDIVVVRHSVPGAAHRLSQMMDASVVNAGDGAHEHPTQGLLDIFSIRRLKKIKGLTVAIVGDIAHSRVARSNIWGLTKLGAKVICVGPPTLVPGALRDMGADISWSLDEVLPECDVVNMLRIQQERQGMTNFPSLREYSRLFGLNKERMKKAKPDVLIMHPGPMNRGVEITPDVADGDHSIILEQVTNGLATRMAVFYLVSGGGEE